MKTLKLVHPVHGVVKRHKFHDLKNCTDTQGVLKVIQLWKHLYGKKFLECQTLWDD